MMVDTTPKSNIRAHCASLIGRVDCSMRAAMSASPHSGRRMLRSVRDVHARIPRFWGGPEEVKRMAPS